MNGFRMKVLLVLVSAILMTSLVTAKGKKVQQTNEQCQEACRDFMHTCIESLPPDHPDVNSCVSTAQSCYGDCLISYPPAPVENCYRGCKDAADRCLNKDCEEKFCRQACKAMRKACKVRCVKQYMSKLESGPTGVLKPVLEFD